MTFIDQPGDNHLPQQRLGQTAHRSIPFYRDIRVLRIVVQVVFAVLFIGLLAVTWISLTNNLEESNVALDFNVFKRRFGAGIPEGVDFTQEWGWVKDVNDTTRTLAVSIVVVVGLALTGNFAYRQQQQKEYQQAAVYGVAGLLLTALFALILRGFLNEIEAYLAPTTVTRAILTGFYNTLKVVSVSLVASTIVGVLVGIGLLSKNFLIRNSAKVYTEIFRNTPLLVQLVFVYQAALLTLPDPRTEPSITSPDSIGPFRFDLGPIHINIPTVLARFYEEFFILNVRGLFLPKAIPTDTFSLLLIATIIALVVGYLVRRWRLARQESTGEPAYTWYFVMPLFLGITGIGWLLAGGYPLDGGPFNVEYTQVGRFNTEGGTQITMFFFALFVGLTLYTSAFIADIVRAGIQSVHYGQIEAARSLGLSGTQVLSMIVLPQALRLIIPPLGNQYVNLGKNSSLGLAVGYADVYLVVNLANNESGQSVPFFAGMMVIYLALSLFFSVLTNLFNSLTRIRTR